MLNKIMETVQQSAWKIIHELKKYDFLPSDKAEKFNRRDWYSHFKDLFKSNNCDMTEVRQQYIRK